ncbi:MAG: hypothetical protein KC733_01755 [Candidatus Omnitrophica bacterium]|nr:hypothetical protein [Candidatus Omnitrophota bacterium]
MGNINFFVELIAYVWYSLCVMGEKRYYMNSVLKILNISKNTYINWEKLGKVPQAKRDPMNNYRYWLLEDINHLREITGRT